MIDAKTFANAKKLIECSNKVLLLSHTRPDGDSCGSVQAMCRVLQKLGKQAVNLFVTPVPRWYEFLFDGEINVLDRNISSEDFHAGRGGWDDFDLVIIHDTNSYVQLPGLEEWVRNFSGSKLVIDHHITNDGIGDVELIDTSAAAAGEIVYEFIRYAGWEVTTQIAESLFVAIATDTGWFRFRNCDGRIFRTTAELVDIGVDPSKLYSMLYQTLSHARVKLAARALDSLELHIDGAVAIQTVRMSDFEETGAKGRETEGLIDEAQKVASVQTAALIVELPDGKCKCSLRSKGLINVREVAQKYGGGGHDLASGVTLDGPLENAKEIITAELVLAVEEALEADRSGL